MFRLRSRYVKQLLYSHDRKAKISGSIERTTSWKNPVGEILIKLYLFKGSICPEAVPLTSYAQFLRAWRSYDLVVILELSGGQICQSCAMPLQKPEDFGSEATGARNKEYCRMCYREGEFTDPDITLEEQIERLVKLAGEKMNIQEEMARGMANEIIPRLKRWRKS